jgi:MAF protein
MQKLFLASESPRRRELLKKAGVSFQSYPSKISEFPQETLTLDEQILDIARRKARAALASLKTKVEGGFWILAADTEVIIEGKLAGKPLDAEDAANKLRYLSNRTHEVKTAVVLVSFPELRELSHLETSQVTFRSLSEDEILKYVMSGDPMDKAGGYGIQGEGAKFVREVRGSIDNVVGLPMEIVLKMFEEMEKIEGLQKDEGKQKNELELVQKEIVLKCQACGRDPKTVRIVAVSKLQPIEKINRLYGHGQRIFAENYVQEAIAKKLELKSLDIEWHLIGHLQKKKLNSILGQFDLIHSIDSLDLARNLAKKCGEKNITQKVLIEVNISQEATKDGWVASELREQWADLLKLSGLKITGLMTMPPSTENPEEARVYFRNLRMLRDELRTPAHPLEELSMGTSQDYLVAIEEGATLVRLGQRIFGERLQK